MLAALAYKIVGHKLCLNLQKLSVPGLWRATQQPAGVRKICILMCKLQGVKVLCCVPCVMTGMWKRSILCKGRRASSCCRKQFENRFKGPSSMFQKLAHLRCFRNLLMAPAINIFMRVQQRRTTSQLRKHAIGIDLQPNGELVLTRS